MRWTILFTLMLLFSSASQAQTGIQLGPAGIPSTPTLSPYLGLLRTDSGPLPNYQQFVRPRLQLRRQLTQQSQAIERQNRTLRSLNQQLNRPTPRAANGMQRAARFLDYSTFYPTLQLR
ncbi:MAG: hypothetical protein AAFX06_08600 [Planctomycetota bacterium]